jgi:hypothetical protein
MEVAFDGLVLLLALIAFVVSQIILDSAVQTHVTDAFNNTTEQYYTLSTCYATYSDEVGVCRCNHQLGWRQRISTPTCVISRLKCLINLTLLCALSQSPACLDKGLDPTSRIRAGLAMLFFCTVFLVLNFLVRYILLTCSVVPCAGAWSPTNTWTS